MSPVAFAFRTLEEVLTGAQASAEVTHNHSGGVRGARAAAAATFLARQGETKKKNRELVKNNSAAI